MQASSPRRSCIAPLRLALTAVLLALATSACTEYQPVPVYSTPSKFDRAWDAARGAAADVGIDVISADRSTGVIRGTKDGTEATISVWTQADGGVRVEINAKSPNAGPDAALAQRLSAAYDRRMGR